MKNLKTFLICLDGTQLDDQVIKYGAMMASFVGCKKAHFIHAGQDEPQLKKELGEKVSNLFDYDCDHEVVFVAGQDARAVMSWSEIKGVDLIIMGIKPKSMSSGKHAAKILDGSLCSVLLVPTNAPIKLEKVLIPIDFSKNSLNAFKLARRIKKQHSLDLLVQHVYYVPTGYHSIGKSYEEFADIVRKNAEKDFNRFQKKYDIKTKDVEVVYTLDEDDAPSDKIYAAAQYEKCDLIMLGSVGKSKVASLILKSTTIDLLNYDENTPCMVVKNKKESLKFFDALLKI